jgi:cytochrome c553
MMTTIMTKTKEITATRWSKQTISELATDATNKALIFYTQLMDCTTCHHPYDQEDGDNGPKTPQVTMTDADEVVQLTQELHDTLNEYDNQFKEFLQGTYEDGSFHRVSHSMRPLAQG